MTGAQSFTRCLALACLGILAACQYFDESGAESNAGRRVDSITAGNVVPARGESLAAIWVESDVSDSNARDLRLPQSGVTVHSEPAVDASGIEDVSLGALEFGPAFVVELRPAAVDALRAALHGRARRVLVAVNGNAIGAARLAEVPPDGKLTFLPELSEAELRSTIAQLHSAFGHDRNRGF